MPSYSDQSEPSGKVTDTVVKECENCRFFVDEECRRFPPSIGQETGNGDQWYSRWPKVWTSCWCGEWQSK